MVGNHVAITYVTSGSRRQSTMLPSTCLQLCCTLQSRYLSQAWFKTSETAKMVVNAIQACACRMYVVGKDVASCDVWVAPAEHHAALYMRTAMLHTPLHSSHLTYVQQ